MEPQTETIIINNNNNNSIEDEERLVKDGGEEVDEEFYEKIEAPKFVDFTVSDNPFRPDDGYWFCLRVGCDRKHEEELDPEEISKNFVLRVMAARSPNIRLQKALSGRSTSTNVKCPLSAPAKSSKPRVSRLAMISSLSQKKLDFNGQVKVKPLSKTSSTSTPMLKKSKPVAAKYMTTPRNKKCIPNPNTFRSVQNPRPTTIAMPESRSIGKTLVFHSPKKAIPLKTSVELRTPLTKLCEGMKRLEITSKRKQRVFGYSGKSLEGTKCDPQKSLPLYPSRRQLGDRNDKSVRKNQEVKSTKNVKSKSRQMLTKQCDSMHKKMSKNDSVDMKIDVKPRNRSALDSLKVIEGNADEEHLKTVKISGNVDSRDSKEVSEVLLPPIESKDTLTKAERSVINSLPNSDTEIDVNRPALGSSMGIEGNDHEERLLKSMNISGNVDSNGSKAVVVSSEVLTRHSEDEISEDQSLPILENEGRHENNQVLQGVGHKKEVMDNDDKENARASDENRDFNHNNNQSGMKFLGRQETHENKKKIVRTTAKNLKDGLTSATTAATDVKCRKPKPTNPKPFRLRTDERGILKEANMERKNCANKEAVTVPRFRRHANDIKFQRNENCSEQSKCSNDVPECSDKESEKNDKKKSSRTVGLKTSKRETCKTPKRCFKSSQQEPNYLTSLHEHSNDNTSQKPDNSLRKIHSPSLPRQLVRPQGRKPIASLIKPGQQLGVMKETSETSSRASKSQGRRPLTVPKEPNFHTAHVPKSCTKNAA